MWVFALLNHGAVSVLCLACGDEALSCERRVSISTNGYMAKGYDHIDKELCKLYNCTLSF